MTFIYVVRTKIHTKVGVSRSPKKRLDQINQGHGPISEKFLWFCHERYHDIEAETVRILSQSHSRDGREWFNIDVGIAVAAVEEAAKNLGINIIETEDWTKTTAHLPKSERSALRIEAGFPTVESLAKEIGATRQRIDPWERGKIDNPLLEAFLITTIELNELNAALNALRRF